MEISYKSRYILLTLMMLMSLGAWTQQKNVLIVPDVKVSIGQVQLPINIENNDEIVAAQFDLTLPSTISAGTDAVLANRCDGHSVIIRNMGATRYRVMLYSEENRPLLAQQGTVFYIPLIIPNTVTEGSELPLVISNATLTVAGGANVLTETKAGKLLVSTLPDLTVKNITLGAETSNMTITPGEILSLSWQVQNIGGAETGDGWSEQIMLVNKRGNIKKLIGTVYQQEKLAAGALMSRQADIVVPQLLGIDGDAYLQVYVVANSNTGESASATGNNSAQSDNMFTVDKRLFVDLIPSRVVENYGRNIVVKVSRSGNWNTEQTFALSVSDDSRATVPSQVTVPVGQSGAIVYMTVNDNNLIDNDSIVTITSGGNGYADAIGTLIIDDNEYPDITLTASKSQVMEGESFQLSIKLGRASVSPVEVTLTSENNKHFSFPHVVTIPAGETSVQVTIEAVEDDLPSLDLSNAFTASASKYNTGEVIVILVDNDIPALELTLTPNQVSENIGPLAVAATLSRTGVTSNRITVKLSDDSNGGIYYGNTNIEMPKGVDEVHFNLGPIDNANVDGDRVVNITAAVYISSCSCNASGESVGVVTAPLTILDNDGAALTLSASATTVKEGDKVTLVVSRNTNASTPLNVTLSSNYSEGLTYPQSVTIPAGQTSTTVEVVSAGNVVQGDSHNVIFTAVAEGFATGTCFLTITDQTKPDAMITDIHVDNYEVEVGQTITLTVVVANNGIASLPARTEVNVSCNGSSERKTLYTPADLPVGKSVVLESDYQLPVSNTGSYILTAIVNPDHKVDELNFNNNSMPSAAITLLPNFTATVTVDKQVYRQGEMVTITGQTSAGGCNSDVEVYLINNGSRQMLTLRADAEGHFQTTYKPYDRQSGHFIAGACYPRTGETSGSAEFDVYGLLLPGVYGTHDISLGDEATGSFIIKNPGSLPQTGLQIERLNEPNGCELTIGQVSSVDADGQVTVNYTLKSNAVSPGSDWLQVPLHITTAEGSTADYTIYYYVRPLKGQLKVNQTHIETTITKGVPREYQMQISNIGRGETGTISLSLPSWVKSLTPMQMPSLASGDTATVVLQLMTTEDMQLNVPVKGQIGVNCEKGDGVPVSIYMTPVSEDKGRLLIDVVDEYTYYAEGGPHVEGARVLVKHPTTGQVIDQGLTGADGHYLVELPEGWYTVSVNADKHQSYQTTLEVAPDRQTGKQIFLTYEAVSYSWDVVETEVEDEYVIETVVTYETNVPKPVILISLPEEKPEVGGIVPIVVTNKGLISAINADLTLSVSEGLTLEWLSDPTLAALAPQQSVTFYAVLKEAESPSGRRKVPGENIGTCISISSKIRSYYICGELENVLEAVKSRSWGDCLKTNFYTNGGSTGGSGGSGGGWSGGGGSTSGTHPGYSPSDDDNNTYSDSSWYGTFSPTSNLCHEKDIEEQPLPPSLNPDPDMCVAEIDDYSLWTVEGKSREVRGVAADGVAKVKICLSGSRPLTIDEATEMGLLGMSCTQIPRWTLNENIGTLEGANTWEPTYIAPPDFPGGPNDNSYTVKAVLHYNVEKDREDTYEINIAITRAPLALIHGLWSSSEAWEDFASHITMPLGSGGDGGGSWVRRAVPREQASPEVCNMYENYQVLCVDYSGSHFRGFSDNVGAVNNVVQDAIDNLKEKYLENGIVAAKADLIGHSMGGVLARLHVQNNLRGNSTVHKLITLNTPHSGSPVANFVNNLPPKVRAALYGYILADTYFNDGEFNLLRANGALLDLAVGSEGTDDYLNDSYNFNSEYLNRMNSVPIHAISSYFDNFNAARYYGIITGVITGASVIKEINSIIEMFEPQPNIFKAVKKGFDGIKSLCNVRDDFYMGLDLADALYLSDGVVPYESETGGLVENNGLKTFCGGFEFHHLSVTENEDVWTHLKRLLNASVEDDELFCKTGWKPIKIEYVASTQNDRRVKASRQHDAEYNPNIQLSVVNDSLHVQINGMDSPVVLVRFNNSAETISENDFMLPIPSTHYGDIKVYTFVDWNDDTVICDSTSINISTPQTAPSQITCKQLCQVFVDKPFKISLECSWADGSVTRVVPDDITFTDRLAYYENGYITGLHAGSGTATFSYQGLTCEAPFTVYNFGKEDEEESSQSVCSTITLKLSQTMTMTRQAFRGTLTMFNGNEAMSMKNVKLALKVTNKSTGEVATAHEFEMHAESIDGFTGEVDLTSGWTLAGKATGTATVLFIPTKYAAPTEPVEWSFGGTLSYLDPFTGLEVTRDLYPVTLTVKPSPELDLTYFMQRDIYGDDPLTEEVEPMVPAEFSLLINNIGYGDATNVRMMTNQPEIIENEKGLLIDFEILSAQLNGGDKTMALGGSVATDFGTIPAHSQAYAQWWLQSSLLGHFTEYDVQATHVTSYGNPDLSLLNDVTIHELIRSIKVDDVVTGFVANDLQDSEDTPDMVYFTDGTTAEVSVAANAVWQKQSSTEYLLTVTPSRAGWNYGNLSDPTFGYAKLIGIRRQSDGKEINLRNFWQTDRTLRDGKDWLYENKLHFIDQMANSAETYVLTFEPRPDVELQVVSFEGVPEEGVVVHEPLQSVTVTFNKAIDASTFTREDIMLYCQGIRLEGPITVTPVSDVQFTLDLSEIADAGGYYVLTVQTAGITDLEGYNGQTGQTATWIQYMPMSLALSFYEAEVIYGSNFKEPVVLTTSPGVPVYTSTNPLVASVDSETGKVTIKAVGTTQVNVSVEETPMSDAAQTSYQLTVLQPQGRSDAPAGIETVSITIPQGETMTTFCSPWPIDFSNATNACRAYIGFDYHDDILECIEVEEAKGGVGLLIVGNPGTYTFPVRISFNDPTENLLVGTLAPTYLEEMTGYKTNLSLVGVKFLPFQAGVIDANKAYLPIEMDDGVNVVNILFEDLTGMNIVTDNFGDDAWYSISGMKVNRPAKKGIYIHNGRKIVVK